MNLKILLYTLFIIIAVACNKETFYTSTDAQLKFSGDTVMFDTVFSNMGSQTLRLMIRNPYDKTIKISKVYLGKGANSAFKININGANSTEQKDVEISANDSAYIFVQIFSTDTGNDMPVLLRDSIVFIVNGATQYVKLLAYNQDVYVLQNQTLKTQTWNGNKPYLIIGDVIVDSLETLTIEKGISVYFHWNSNLIVKGSLRAQG